MISADEIFMEGTASLARRDVRNAVTLFNSAEQGGFDRDACAALRWQCWMLLGEFECAWAESDALTARGAPDEHRLWDGLSFTGKRVIIRCLHGYGDAIQFLRYASLLRASASYVIVETHPEMVALVRGIPGVDKVMTWTGKDRAEDHSWDQQIEVMELPRAFRTTFATIPATLPYISVKPGYGCRLPQFGLPKIGLVWGASSWNPVRSTSLAELAPLLSLNGFSFYSFQRGPQRGELSECAYRDRIYDTADLSPDIADTAADLLKIDLLITVDTMAAHVAGALGRNVWVLLPFEADWRWMLDRDDSPWYPTMKLFRQPRSGAGWYPVVRRVRQELSALLSRRA